MPVLDQQLGLIELLPQRFVRAQAEFVVNVLVIARIQHLQTAFDRQSRRDDQYRFRVARILRVMNGVQALPSDDQRHQRSFAGTGRHFAANAFPRPAPSPGRKMPCLKSCGASSHQISASIASNWQKYSGYWRGPPFQRFSSLSHSPRSCQCSSNCRVTLVMPGQPASHQLSRHSRIALTRSSFSTRRVFWCGYRIIHTPLAAALFECSAACRCRPDPNSGRVSDTAN